MKVLDFIYNETTISFESTSKDDVMVNATEMAKAFDKRIDHFLKADHTQKFIEALKTVSSFGNLNSKSGDEFTPNGGNSDYLKQDEIIQTRGQNGTWMHRLLALKFAAWLDPNFEVWVWRTIDAIILGIYREVKDATFEKLEAESQYEKEKVKLMEKYPELGNLLVKQGIITEAEKRRVKLLKAATAQLKIEFEKRNS